MDYKTGKPKDEKKAREDLQLSVYALAAREVFDLAPKRLVFYNLMTNEPVATTRDAKALAATVHGRALENSWGRERCTR